MSFNPQGPYTFAFPITPDAGNTLSNITSAVLCTASGNVNMTFLNPYGVVNVSNSQFGNTSVYLTRGVIYPLRVVKVFSTGSDGSIVGLV